MKEKTYRRCPNGKVTASVRLYLKEWYSIIRPLEKRMGMKVLSFDPDIQLAIIKDEKILSTFAFPLWIAEKILRKKIKRTY
jgi:hypothetical protein